MPNVLVAKRRPIYTKKVHKYWLNALKCTVLCVPKYTRSKSVPKFVKHAEMNLLCVVHTKTCVNISKST